MFRITIFHTFDYTTGFAKANGSDYYCYQTGDLAKLNNRKRHVLLLLTSQNTLATL